MTTSRVALFALLCAGAVAGCRTGISAPRTVPTSGTVLYKGKPAEGVKVTLHPKFDMGSIPFTPNGMTGKDGRFVLSTADANDGAPPGEYSVTFEMLRPGADARGLDIDIDLWKGKYSNPDTAPTVTVSSSATTLEPFHLQ